MKKIISMLLSTTLVVVLTIGVFAESSKYEFKTNVPQLTEEMLDSEFWINKAKHENKAIMSKDDINKYNQEIVKEVEEVVDLKNYSSSYSKEELTSFIQNLSSVPSAPRYDKDGNLITQEYYDNLLSNLNIKSLQENNDVRYGITVRRTLMKTFPTFDMIFKQGDNYEFDRFMETAVYPVEPLTILSTSKDGQWYFAQMYNYRAWIPVKDVALTTKDELFEYLDTDNKLVVTGDKIQTVYNPFNEAISELNIDMGVSIPLVSKNEIPEDIADQDITGNYIVKLPVRNEDGSMSIENAIVKRSSDVNIGYLEYTKENIISQAFKFLGERYGWGGMFNGRDCSSFLMDVYRTVGVNLPRNTGEQESAPAKTYDMTKQASIGDKEKILGKVQEGSAIYMSGHAMMYLGKYKGEHYMIHDFSGFYGPNNKYYKSRQVMVTPVKLLLTEDKTTYLEDFTSIKEFILNK